MKKVLIIGGSGFLGSHVADEFTERGYNVTILDKQKSIWLSKKQKMVVCDIDNEKLLNQAMKNIHFIYVFSGISGLDEAKLQPYNTIQSNILGTCKILELAIKNKVKRIFFASSMYIYSKAGSFYKTSKQCSELLIKTYCENSKLKFTIIRYGSLYGTRSQNWNGIKKFLNDIIQKGSVSYEGTGNEIRDYINVSDASKLSVDIINKKYENKAVTLTGTQQMKVSEMLLILFEILGKKPKIKFKRSKNSDIHYGLTPYTYKPLSSNKIISNEFIDFGQGIINIIDEIKNEKS